MIGNIEDWFLVDTGFNGDLIVKTEIFDKIRTKPSDGGEVCVAKDLCFSALQKVVSIDILERQILCRALWIPELEDNIVGEGAINKSWNFIRLQKFYNFRSLD